jgi:hypothetical protein
MSTLPMSDQDCIEGAVAALAVIAGALTAHRGHVRQPPKPNA